MTRPPRSVVVIVVLAVLAGIALVATCGRSSRGGPLLASGTVEATEAQLGFPTTGRLDTLTVREGDRVVRGQILARLDSAETAARLEEAKARAAASREGLAELERGSREEEVARARAFAAAAQERLRDATRDLERARILFEGGAVSQELVDKAEVAESIARSDAEQAGEELRLLEIGPRRERIAQQRAVVAQSDAQVHTLEATLANLTITAPIDGIVTVRHREPGEIVSAGSPVVTVMNPDDRWVRIYIKEDRVGAVKLGSRATLTADGFRGMEFAGEVSFVASEAEFTPKTVQTPEERVKLVYAVKVRITGDGAHDLKPGMPADVRLEPPTS